MAATPSTLLIRGESGTGKRLLASLLHYLGPNPDEPLVHFDCAGLPSDLIESELFGCESGFPAGITQAKRGLLELAGRGAVVLHEVAALSMPLQAKLLRYLEEGKLQRLGGTRPVNADARVIALTAIDLERAVARHTFREDLYYRLQVSLLSVPPLRQRPGDVIPLAGRLLDRLCAVHRRPEMTLARGALCALESYPFPGNVRELRDLLARALAHSTSAEVCAEDLPAHVRQHVAPANARMSLEQMERVHIADVLEFTHGKKTRAAKILGISRKTLLEKRKRYGLD